MYGMVGFIDAGDSSWAKEEVSLQQGELVTEIKSWTAANNVYPNFCGWESFNAIVPSDGEVAIRVKVRNSEF